MNLDTQAGSGSSLATDLVHEVPDGLKRLVKLVISAFYAPELVNIVSALMKHQCVREDALADLLLFDRKQLRQAISTMRYDKLIHARYFPTRVNWSKLSPEKFTNPTRGSDEPLTFQQAPHGHGRRRKVAESDLLLYQLQLVCECCEI